ncbi:hypothetical protein KFU94_31645 [Chloroflexi bacterium TSY]|nr:hypothetical protein [Chloroflexi bacterium TSY]
MNWRKDHLVRMLFMLTLLSVVLTSFAGKSLAQGRSSDLTMQVDSAFEGTVKNGEWLPVWVELENRGSDLDVEVRVEVKNRVGTTTYAAALSLPTNSRKRTPVYVQPNPYTRELLVQVIDVSALEMQNQPLLEQKIPVQSVANQSLLIGHLSSERGPLSTIQEVQFVDGSRDKILVGMDGTELPPKAEDLRSLNVLIINDIDTSILSAEQGSALESWVRAGGHLIVGGGGNAARTVIGLPPNLQPQLLGTPTEIEQVDELVNYVVQADGTSREKQTVEGIKVAGPFVVHGGTFVESKILVGNAELPLMIETSLGLGTIHYVAPSLTDSPFNAWAGNANFWQTLLERDALYPDWLPPDTSEQQMRSSHMSSALSQLPSLDLPSVRGLGILLAIYIALVGPVNYLLLRWFRRLHWAWITIPLLTLIFSAGSFGIGYAMRGTDLILNHIAVVEPSPNNSGHVMNYMGLFSPAEQSYEIELDSNNLISPMSQQSNPFFAGPMGSQPETSSNMTIINGHQSRIRGLTVNQWSMQSFQTEETWHDFGQLGGEFRLTESNLEGEIRNELNYSLEDAVVIFGRQFERLGDLEIDDSVSISFKMGGLERERFDGHIWWEIYRNVLDDGSPGRLSRQNDLKRQIAEAVFQNRFHPPHGGPSSLGQGILLLGWMSEAPVNVQISGRTPIHQTTTLVHTRFPITLPEAGKMTLPPALITAHIIKHPTQGNICETPNSLYMQSGNAELQFELPNGHAFEHVENLTLNVRSNIGDHTIPASIAFYQWDEEKWLDAVGTDDQTFVIEQPNAIINQNGLIRVRVIATRSFDACGYFDLSVTGEL